MTLCKCKIAHRVFSILAPVWFLVGLVALSTMPLAAQGPVQSDPAEPIQNKPNPKILPHPARAIPREAVDEKSMRELIERLVAYGTRNSLSSWEDPKRGVGCGRDQIVARLSEIANASGGKLRVVVDKFETLSARTSNKAAHMENVYAVLPGSDPALSKTVFLISGHFDSRATDVMDPGLDAPGADDDASGVAVSMECARLLSRTGAGGNEPFRATLLFAAISGEEQGLLGSARMLEWVKDQGYTVGGMLDNDIVGSDAATSAPHRVRLFSGSGDQDDNDSSSRELARAIEEIDGRQAIRLIFSIDRLGRGGDHYVFYSARATRRSLHGAPRGLSPPASDAADRKRNRIWRSDEVLEYEIHGQCSSRQCGGAAAVGARTRSADGSETFGWSFA